MPDLAKEHCAFVFGSLDNRLPCFDLLLCVDAWCVREPAAVMPANTVRHTVRWLCLLTVLCHLPWSTGIHACLFLHGALNVYSSQLVKLCLCIAWYCCFLGAKTNRHQGAKQYRKAGHTHGHHSR